MFVFPAVVLLPISTLVSASQNCCLLFEEFFSYIFNAGVLNLTLVLRPAPALK
jgi:hypothetical protein